MLLSHPAGNEFTGRKHTVLLSFREHMDADYGEIIDSAEEMERDRVLVRLRCGACTVGPVCGVQADADKRVAPATLPRGGAAGSARPRRHRCHVFRPPAGIGSLSATDCPLSTGDPNAVCC